MEPLTLIETIRALYTDIAAIKEFICKEKEGETLTKTGGFYTESPATLNINADTKILGIFSDSAFALSRILDYDSARYDEYTFTGFGSICQIGSIGDERWDYPFEVITRREALITIKPYVVAVRLRPKIGASMDVSLYSPEAPVP